MKRALSLIMAIVTCLSCAVLLASCGHECEWAADWSKDATHHWKACTDPECTEVGEKAEHTFGAGTEIAFGVTQYTCSVCGEIKTDEKVTEVASDKWEDAFKLGENFVATLTGSHPTEGSQQMLIAREGNKMMGTESYTSPSGESQSYNMYVYLDGDTVIRFECDEEDGEEVWSRDLDTIQSATDFVDLIYSQIFFEEFKSATSFTYNADSNVYTAATAGAYTDVNLYFIDGKVVKYTASYEFMGTVINYEGTITYGNSSITLPEVDGTVTEAEFNAAFDFGTDYFSITHTTYAGTRSQLIIGYYGDTVAVGVNYYNQYFYNDNGTYYSIIGNWNNKLPCSQDSFNQHMNYMLNTKFTFAQLTYDSVTGVYKIASAVIGGEQASDVRLYFNDGELECVTYKTSNGKLNKIEYSIEYSKPVIPGKPN